MRFIFLAVFLSSFHCNIDGFLNNLPILETKTSAKKSKTKKSRKSVSFYDNSNVGEILDQLDGVKVHFNGPITNVNGRNTTPDGYNLGLKYQCVEFVKRYYYEVYNHKMPNSYGHAKEFYDLSIRGHGFNKARGLKQFANGGIMRPMHGDLVVFGHSDANPFGHVGIVSAVGSDFVEMVQQNVAKQTRAKYRLVENGGHHYISDSLILGWLRR